jgi:hypothetical protein
MEAFFPATSSRSADEGTAAHTMREWCLNEVRPAADYPDSHIQVNGEWYSTRGEMAEAVQRSLDHIGTLESIDYAKLYVEVRVPISHITGEEGAEGTSDAVLVTPDELIVNDLKYGANPNNRVDAEQNGQLRLYGAGTVEWLRQEGREVPERIRYIIDQPRLNHISEWSESLEELEAWVDEEVRPAAERALEYYYRRDRFVTAEPDGSLFIDPPFDREALKPSGKACQWCRALAVCPAAKRKAEDALEAGFAALVEEPTLDQQSALEQAYRAIPFTKKRMEAVENYIFGRLITGQPVGALKLALGRGGNAAWGKDNEYEEEATKRLKAMRFKNDDIFVHKLMSPTQIRKLLGDQPKRLEKLEELITRSEPKPQVALPEDKRPAWLPPVLEDEFAVLAEASASADVSLDDLF